jgi:hypothetical protein
VPFGNNVSSTLESDAESARIQWLNQELRDKGGNPLARFISSQIAQLLNSQNGF